MAFDGLFLHASIAEIQAFLPAKINKIQGVSDTDTLFQLRGQRASKTLMISAHSQYNRIHFSNKRYTTFETPSNFIMVLRKFLDGGTMEEVEQLGLDRAMKFTIRVRNELGDLHLRYLYVELMGKYANLILVDADGRIVDAIKRIPPFLENKRTIHPGAQFVPVEQQEKKNPLLCETLELETSLQTQYYGFSKILETEVRHRLAQGTAWSAIATMLANAHTLYTYPSTTKRVFHILELTHLQQTPITAPLMDGIDALFDVVEEQERIRQQSGDLFKVVKKEIAKNKAKLPKLQKTLAQAYNGEQYRMYGDLLFAYMYQIQKGDKRVTLTSFEDESQVTIELNPKWDVKTNANKYYNLYHKSKTAIIEMEKQIQATTLEIDYLESIQAQLDYANFQDALEIRQELVDHKLLAPTSNRIRKSKIKAKPNILQFEVDGIPIYVGKNNLQNDYITFQLARKHHTWFHAKDIHGSHVLVLDEAPSEHVIRTAALLASYYSKARQSSSVPVNYTSVKNLKKPKQRVLGLVYLQNYKTIYIDPEQDLIDYIHKNYLIK